MRITMHKTAYQVEAVYRDDTHGSTSYKVTGGQKTYIRVWDTGQREWAWVLNEHAKPVDADLKTEASWRRRIGILIGVGLIMVGIALMAHGLGIL